jgi:hypothetical protein
MRFHIVTLPDAEHCSLIGIPLSLESINVAEVDRRLEGRRWIVVAEMDRGTLDRLETVLYEAQRYEERELKLNAGKE